MKLELVSFTPNLERVIATAVLTTATGSPPSRIFERLSKTPEQVERLLDGLQLQHGSVLEHNRISWFLEASSEEVLDTLIKSRFFTVTKLKEGLWLMSANLRTVVEGVMSEEGELSEALLTSMQRFAPRICGRLGGKSNES